MKANFVLASFVSYQDTWNYVFGLRSTRSVQPPSQNRVLDVKSHRRSSCIDMFYISIIIYIRIHIHGEINTKRYVFRRYSSLHIDCVKIISLKIICLNHTNIPIADECCIYVYIWIDSQVSWSSEVYVMSQLCKKKWIVLCGDGFLFSSFCGNNVHVNEIKPSYIPMFAMHSAE